MQPVACWEQPPPISMRHLSADQPCRDAAATTRPHIPMRALPLVVSQLPRFQRDVPAVLRDCASANEVLRAGQRLHAADAVHLPQQGLRLDHGAWAACSREQALGAALGRPLGWQPSPRPAFHRVVPALRKAMARLAKPPPTLPRLSCDNGRTSA